MQNNSKTRKERMTKIYKLKKGAFEKKKNELFKRGILISIIAVLGGFLISTINSGFNWKVLLLMIPTTGIAIFIGLKRGLKLHDTPNGTVTTTFGLVFFD